MKKHAVVSNEQHYLLAGYHADMKLYGAASTRTRRCLWTLEEVGADFDFERIDLRSGGHKSPAYLKLNPNARVPALEDDGLVLFESAAICQYIARKYPAAELLPAPGSKEEALHDQWMYWVVTELEQALWSMGKHRFALPEEYRVPEMLRTATFEWRRAVAVLAAAKDERPFLLGEQLRLVDIMTAHTLLWARGFTAAFESDVLERYLDRMIHRPAFLATKAYD